MLLGPEGRASRQDRSAGPLLAPDAGTALLSPSWTWEEAGGCGQGWLRPSPGERRRKLGLSLARVLFWFKVITGTAL